MREAAVVLVGARFWAMVRRPASSSHRERREHMTVASSRASSQWRGGCWVGLRVALPCSVGLLCGLLWLTPAVSPWGALPSGGFAIAFACAVALRLRSPSPAGYVPIATSWQRWQWLFLGVALLGSCSCAAAQALSASKAWAWATGYLGVAGGLGAILVSSLGDVHWARTREQRYAIVATPWLAAFALGSLGSWLLVRGRTAELVLAKDQRLLSLVMVAVVLELLLFLGWRGSLLPGIQGEQFVFRDRRKLFGRLATLRAWGGCIASAALIVLTMTNEGIWFAFLAWALLLLGEGVWYVLLLGLLDEGARRSLT